MLQRFREPLDSIAADGYLAERSEQRVALTREGLLRVDGLLKRFFLPEHAGSVHMIRTAAPSDLA